MILCVGEILADMIGNGRGDGLSYDGKAGGAPFNVACGIKRFGAESAFVGNVGDDVIGRYLQAFAKERVNESFVRLDPSHNTTLAFVRLDERGDRSFCFYRKNTADIYLPPVPERMFAAANIVHIGSLMLSEERGARYARELAQRAKKAGKIVSFDVNYRADIFSDRTEAVSVYKSMLELSDVAKLSEEEYFSFGETYVAEKLQNALVCVTLGAKGSEWRFRGRSRRLPAPSVKPVDTTGAGDAFYAGVLAKLDALTGREWTADVLDGIFRFANVCGALSTQARGAIDALPSLEEAERVLRGI